MSWKFMIARIAPDADVSEIEKNLDKRLFREVMFFDCASMCECAAGLPPTVTPERMVAADDGACAKDDTPEKTGDAAAAPAPVGEEQAAPILETTCLNQGMDTTDSTYVTCREESQVVGDDEQRGRNSHSPLNYNVPAEGSVERPDTPRMPLNHSVPTEGTVEGPDTLRVSLDNSVAQGVAVESSRPLMSLDHSLQEGGAADCERANQSIRIAHIVNDFDASRKAVEDRDNETGFSVDGLNECIAMEFTEEQSESQEEEFGTEQAMDGEEEQKEKKEEEKSKIENETAMPMDIEERQMEKGKEEQEKQKGKGMQINKAIDDDEEEEKQSVNERKQCEIQPPMAQPEQEEIEEDRTGSEEGGAQMDAVFERNDDVVLPDDVPFDSRQTCAVCQKPVVVYCRSKPKKSGGQDVYVYRSSVLHHILPHLRRRRPAFPLQFACSHCKWQTARPYSITRHFKTCTKGRAVKVHWTREQLDMIRRMRKTCFPKLYGQR